MIYRPTRWKVLFALTALLVSSFQPHPARAIGIAQPELISSNLIPAIQNLSIALQNFERDFASIGQSLNTYAPEIIGIGQNATQLAGEYLPAFETIGQNLTSSIQEYGPEMIRIGQSLSVSMQNVYDLANQYAPGIDQNSEKAAEALSQLAEFAQYLESNRVVIACSAVAVLAAGIVIGNFASEHIFVLEKEKNYLYRLSSAVTNLASSCKLPTLRALPLSSREGDDRDLERGEGKVAEGR